MAALLVAFGTIFLLVGGGIVVLFAPSGITRMLLMPTVPIKLSKEDALVHLRGRVLPNENVTVTAPFTGRKVVWFRATALFSAWPKGTSPTLTVAQDFLLEDDSGERARVRISDGHATVHGRQGENVWTGQTRHAPSPRLLEFLLRHKVPIGDARVQFIEERLSLGQQLSVIGRAQRVPALPAREGYRDATSTELVVRGNTDVEPLHIVVDSTEVIHFRARLARSAAAACALGLFMLIVGVVLAR